MEITPTSYNPLELDSNRYTAINTEINDIENERKQRMAQVVAKFASALTSRIINVSVQDDNQSLPTEAWSDAENIWFNGKKLGDLTDPEVALAIKGLSLHEIGHILLTPRAGSNLVKWVRSNEYEKAFNMLEDQRTELFLASKYSNVKHWFTASIAKHLLSKPKDIEYMFPIIHGRSFLPADLRNAVRKAFVDQSITSQLASIIDNYTVLNLADSAHIPTAMKLIEQFHALIASTLRDESKDTPYQKHSGWDKMPDMHDDSPGAIMKSSEKSKPMNKAGQDRIIDKILKERGKQQQESDGDEEGEEYDKPESGDQPGDEPGTDGNGDSESDADGDPTDTKSDGENNKAGQGSPDSTNNIQQLAQQHLNKTKDILRDDLQDMVAQFNGEASLTSKNQPTPQRSHWEQQLPVPTPVITQVKSFVNQLELIRAEYDPGWKRRVSAGKLNVYRYMTGAEPDEVFDLWDDGREDVVDIEAVILLDNSGSMGWTIESAHDSMWAIKRSLDKIGASTTVLTFADDARMLYDSTQKAKVTKTYVGTAGGTNPKQAIDYAKYVFANSDRAIKILIMITDGEWWNADEQDRIVSQLRRAGVITALGFIDPNGAWSEETKARYASSGNKTQVNGHGAEIVVALDNGGSLLQLAKALVKAGIKRNLNK